jgi:hypothetical protein
MSMQQWSPAPRGGEAEAVAHAVGFARSLISEGCADLEARTAAFVAERIAGSTADQAAIVQRTMGLLRAETAQQQQLAAQQQQSALQSGLLQVATAGVQNVSAATASLFATVQQELSVLRHLVADLRTSHEELRTAGAAGDVAREIIRNDMTRCVAEIGGATGRLRKTEADLRLLEHRISEVDNEQIKKLLDDMQTSIDEGAEAQGQDHASLQKSARAISDMQKAHTASIRRLDDRISQRAKATSLARAEKRLGDDTAILQGQVVTLSGKVEELSARVDARVDVQPVGQPGPTTGAGLAEAITALASAIPLIGTGKRAQGPTEPPTKYAIHDVRSWPILIAEAGIIGAETKIRMDLGVMSATAKGSHSFSLLWKWVVATLATCPESMSEEHLELGQQLLRDTRIAAAGASFSDVSKAMSKTDWGDDELGRVLSTARTDGRIRLAATNSKLTCWYCSKPGHSAHACRARIAAGAEVPKQAPKKPDQPSPAKPRQGGDKGTH